MRCRAYGKASAGVPPPSGLRSSACTTVRTSPTVTAAPAALQDRTSILARTSPVSRRRNRTVVGGEQAGASSSAWCGPRVPRNVLEGSDMSRCSVAKCGLAVASWSLLSLTSSSTSGSGIGSEMSGVGGVDAIGW
ncbi:unnamed protein product [Mycena citricolor]|uniref:Uncharacterized protein n=1 Tax=Mycena citricolor TaxID=2018698 RepID=A0AAD2H047_9AGAR|nr:unnamed protein product [Mycena citricolor]